MQSMLQACKYIAHKTSNANPGNGPLFQQPSAFLELMRQNEEPKKIWIHPASPKRKVQSGNGANGVCKQLDWCL